MEMQKIRGTMVLAGALFLIVAASYAEGNQERERRSGDYGEFTSLRIEVPGEVTLQRGPRSRVEADIPRGWRETLVIRNQNGTLVIEERRPQLFRLTADRPRFIITMPTIETLTLSGSASLHSEDRWEGEEVELNLSGSGKMRLGPVSARQVEATVSGSGSLAIGEIEAPFVRMGSSGSGELLVRGVLGEEVELRSSGSGDITLSIDAEALDASTSGSADLTLRGHVVSLRLRTSGSGSVRGAELLADGVEVRMSGSGNVTLQEGSGVTTVRSSGSGSLSLQ